MSVPGHSDVGISYSKYFRFASVNSAMMERLGGDIDSDTTDVSCEVRETEQFTAGRSRENTAFYSGHSETSRILPHQTFVFLYNHVIRGSSEIFGW